MPIANRNMVTIFDIFQSGILFQLSSQGRLASEDAMLAPSESTRKWGVRPPPDNGTIRSNPTLRNQGLEPAPR